jgi:NADH:ubiquinone oxidoreductase subunit H
VRLITVAVLRRLAAPFPTPIPAPGARPRQLLRLPRFAAKTLFFFFCSRHGPAVVPRYRYDQLMRLGWKVFLPTSLAAVALIGAWRVFGPAA